MFIGNHFIYFFYAHLYFINVESFANELAAREMSVSTIGLTTLIKSENLSSPFREPILPLTDKLCTCPGASDPLSHAPWCPGASPACN